MRGLSVILLLVIAISIVVIASLVRPDRLTEVDFLLNIAWILILSGLNWGVSSYIFFTVGDGKKSSDYGALPSLSIVVFIYSIISVALMTSSWYATDFNIHTNWHLIAQFIAFGLTAAISILILITARGADIRGLEDVVPKEELTRRVAALISGLPETHKDIKKELKKLNEIIRYSMPHPARLYSTKNYQKLHADISSINLSGVSIEEWKEKIETLKELARSC